MDRRHFLRLSGLGGIALGGGLASSMLTACGSDASPTSFVVAKRFADSANTPGRLRLPVALQSPDDASLLTDGPAELRGRVLDAAGAELAAFTAPRHAAGLAVPYWPIVVEVAAAGVYSLEIDGAEGDTGFQVFDPADVTTPAIGAALPPFDTPTADDERGVDPFCTLTPDPCPFHAVTLTDALASGKHVVYMVGTPAHCQFGTCGPGLEFLVAASAAYADRAVFVHAEVFADDTATTVAPAVRAVGLDYEPVIYITDRAGLVVERLDVVWDRPELDEVLARTLA